MVSLVSVPDEPAVLGDKAARICSGFDLFLLMSDGYLSGPFCGG